MVPTLTGLHRLEVNKGGKVRAPDGRIGDSRRGSGTSLGDAVGRSRSALKLEPERSACGVPQPRVNPQPRSGPAARRAAAAPSGRGVVVPAAAAGRRGAARGAWEARARGRAGLAHARAAAAAAGPECGAAAQLAPAAGCTGRGEAAVQTLAGRGRPLEVRAGPPIGWERRGGQACGQSPKPRARLGGSPPGPEGAMLRAYRDRVAPTPAAAPASSRSCPGRVGGSRLGPASALAGTPPPRAPGSRGQQGGGGK